VVAKPITVRGEAESSHSSQAIGFGSWQSMQPADDPAMAMSYADEEYCTRYNRCTRTFLTKAKDSKGYFEPALCNMYEAGSSGGTRIQAISVYN
jgi:hypothetical protein